MDESVSKRDTEPQTPKRRNYRIVSHEIPSTPTPDTPPSSPEYRDDSIFSPGESVSTDVTDDYGWDSPSRQPDKRRRASLVSVSDVSENEGEIKDEDEDPDPALRSPILKKVKSVDGLAGKDDSAATSPAALDEKDESTVAVKEESPVDVKEEEGETELSLLETYYKICPEDKERESPGLLLGFSFHSGEQFNFMQEGEAHRTKERSKSPTPTIPAGVPEIKVTAPSQPPDKTPFIKFFAEEVRPAVKKETSGPTPRERAHARVSLGRILPYSFRDLLDKNGSKCVPSGESSCSRPGQQKDVQAALCHLEGSSVSDMANVGQIIRDLVESALCKQHRKTKGRLFELDAWFGEEPLWSAAHHTTTLTEWIDALTGRNKKAQKANGTGSSDASQDSETVEATSVSLNVTLLRGNKGSVSPIQNLQQYNPKTHLGKSVQQRIREELTKPLTAKEIKTAGFIYIFWYRGNFGFVKIGYTSKKPDERLGSWERQCGRKLWRYFPHGTAALLPVNHVCRIEKLVHAELKDTRMHESCHCGSDHREWFQVDGDFAITVVKKWIKWMRQMPYVEESTDNGESAWVLDEKRAGKIADLYNPSPMPSTERASKARPVWASRSSLGRTRNDKRRRRVSSGL